MDPSWDIKAVIVEPGGFRTEWAGDSLKTFPPLRPYADPNSPTSQFRNASLDSSKYIGDPTKAAKAFIEIANMPDPPLRMQLGTESMAVVIGKAKETLRNGTRTLRTRRTRMALTRTLC